MTNRNADKEEAIGAVRSRVLCGERRLCRKVQATGPKGRREVGGQSDNLVRLLMDDGRGWWYRHETSG